MRKTRPPEERFWAKVDKTDTCWLWTGAIAGTTGYGSFYFNGSMGGAHRFAYEHFVGPIPEGYWIDHLCRVRRCVNPDHLAVVTPRENAIYNSLSTAAFNARKTHCPRGHPYNDANTRIANRPSGNTARICRACRSIRYFLNEKPKRPRRYVNNADKTHCKRGHEFTPENTRLYTWKNGKTIARFCRACERIRERSRIA